MTTIVTDRGFAPDSNELPFVTAADLAATSEARALDLGPADRVADIKDRLGQITIIRIAFPAFSDGRGFTIAHDLRRAGYKGTLRAAGHVLADQYAMIRRAGFDEVEISAEHAARQPEPQWLYRADWRTHDHRSRLFA